MAYDRNRYLSYDQIASEQEVFDLLCAFTRAVKPDLVVELGTYDGRAAQAIGWALEENDHGRCITYEVGDISHAIARVNRHPCVEIRNEDYNVAVATFDQQIDMLFVDGGPEREKDYQPWYKKLTVGGLMFVHDAVHGHEWSQDRADIIMPMQRGLAIIQKRALRFPSIL